MFYEFKCKVTKVDKNGNDRSVTEHFVTDAELFGEVENKAIEMYNNECDIVAIYKSRIVEIVNKSVDLEDKWFKVIIVSVFKDDSGKEKRVKYPVLVAARDIDDATLKSREYMRQGLTDMFVESVSETRIIDIV